MEIFVVILIAMFCSLVYGLISSKKGIKQHREWLDTHFGQAPTYRTDLKSAEGYYDDYIKAHPDATALDDITWHDLSMDDVFHRINICQTSIGEEMLYKRLRVLGDVPEDFESWLKAVRRDKEGRLDCQSYLSQMGKTPYSGLTTFLTGKTLIKVPSHALTTFMGFLPLIALVSCIFIGYAGLLLALLSAICNIAYAAYFKHKLESQLVAIRTMSKMLWCASKLSALQIEGLESLLGRIKELHSLFRPLKSRMSSLSQERVAMADMMAMQEFAKLFMLTDVRAYAKSAPLILKQRDKALELYESIGYLDLLISVASFRKSLGAVCAPTFHDEMSLSMERMGHPLLVRPIENSCELKRDTLITGSNASGKSTFIKAVAVNAVLAQTIHTCAAKSFVLPRAHVISSMALQDSILRGDSYFVAEIKSFRRIMEASRKMPCLCFVDEILRGTNTVERIGASAAVLYSMSQENCLCLVASHDIELTRILENEFDNYHFEETVSDKGVSFDYTLKQGPSCTRNAILLLSTLGFETDIIDQAHELVKAFEQTNAWPTFTYREGQDAITQA